MESMHISSAEIENIVRAVVQRLRSMPAAQSSPAQASSLASSHSLSLDSAVNPTASKTLRLEQKLITLEVLRGRWGTIDRLQVNPRAVVTPAVVDELRKHAVQLERLDCEASQRVATGVTPWLLIAPPAKATGLLRQLTLPDVRVSEAVADETRVAQSLLEHFADGGGGVVWCAARPYAAARSCAQQAAIAAVQLAKIDDLPRAITEAKPNALVIDDRDWTVPAVLNLIRSWTRSWTR